MSYVKQPLASCFFLSSGRAAGPPGQNESAAVGDADSPDLRTDSRDSPIASIGKKGALCFRNENP